MLGCGGVLFVDGCGFLVVFTACGWLVLVIGWLQLVTVWCSWLWFRTFCGLLLIVVYGGVGCGYIVVCSSCFVVFD